MLTVDEWKHHNKWEEDWWGDCSNTFEEQLKQEVYIHYMKLDQFAIPGHWFDMRGKSIIDIGGGPISILLRCKNFSKAVVVDPCPFPMWVTRRYNLHSITHIRKLAENYAPPIRFDEAWLYNCLQHVLDPEKVVNLAKNAKKVRVFEYCNIGVCEGHPHNLTKELLDKLFDRQGLTEWHDGLVHGVIYFGVFNYEV